MASDSYAAVVLLRQAEHWRSMQSRAYFAAYARVVSVLIDAGVTMPKRGNPAHTGMAELMQHHLYRLSPVKRTNLASALMTLYKLRVIADYGPTSVVSYITAATATGLMMQIFRELREV